MTAQGKGTGHIVKGTDSSRRELLRSLVWGAPLIVGTATVRARAAAITCCPFRPTDPDCAGCAPDE